MKDPPPQKSQWREVREATNHSLVVSFLGEGGKNLVTANATYSPMSEELLAVLNSLFGPRRCALFGADQMRCSVEVAH